MGCRSMGRAMPGRELGLHQYTRPDVDHPGVGEDIDVEGCMAYANSPARCRKGNGVLQVTLDLVKICEKPQDGRLFN
jgi:hypothetical protein